jgi:DNA-binding PadR family transcriptional regulator
MGAKVSHSILDLFILSLLDRGLETSYDLHIHGGLSLGSTIPALRRLETAGLIRKKDPVGSSKRPRHWFQLSATGRKLARGGWISLLKDQPPSDFDAILRLADIAQHYRVKPADIVSFLEAAASERRSSARSGVSEPLEMHDSLRLVATREAWDLSRLGAEAKFLEGLAKSFRQNHANAQKR